MRVTRERKLETRQRVLDAALELFRSGGFDATTTRDIAKRAGIAVGTLFNYFPTKESVAAELAGQALGRARDAFEGRADARRTAKTDLEEELFALVCAEVRELKPFRKLIVPLLETAFSPLAATRHGDAGDDGNDALRVAHLEIVTGLALGHGAPKFSPVALQVYWSLYCGVLAFWSGDTSPKQEDTLALLDQSMKMFVAWLRSPAAGGGRP